MKFYMAPLQSYTTTFYRKAHALTFGEMSKYFTPFFEDTGAPIDSINFNPELNSELNKQLYVVPQVATNSGSFLTAFANKMKNRGYKEININMGCPFPMLVKRQRGGGLLNQPDKIRQLLDPFEKAKSDIKLSVKMRLGLDDISQGLKVIQILNDYQLEELILHPRLVSQKYTGTPDWDSFAHLTQMSKHTIVANGNINNSKDLASIMDFNPHVNTFMLGRGLLTKPDLYTELSQDNVQVTATTIQQLHHHYFKLITSYYKDWNRAFNFLQAFWHYPLSTSIEKQRLLRKLKKHNKPDLYSEWLALVKDII